MACEANVIARANVGGSRVDSHANTDLSNIPPPFAGERPLSLRRSGHRACWIVEYSAKPVSGATKDKSTVDCDCRVQQLVMACLCRFCLARVEQPQPGTALHIREQKGN